LLKPLDEHVLALTVMQGLEVPSTQKCHWKRAGRIDTSQSFVALMTHYIERGLCRALPF
jgi:hypothetical protein